MYSVGLTPEGRFYIQDPYHKTLAWSPEPATWVPLTPLFDDRSFIAITFDTEEELEDYVNDHELYPRRD
jgi:hypothetical protein